MENFNFFIINKSIFLLSKMKFFYPIQHCKTLSLTYLPKREIISTFIIFGKNHRLSPLKIFDFFIIDKSTFLAARMFFFLPNRTSQTLSLSFFPKREIISKFPIFDKNHGLTPLEKIYIFLNFHFLTKTMA